VIFLKKLKFSQSWESDFLQDISPAHPSKFFLENKKTHKFIIAFN
jgi:hypothetical protein